MKKLARNFTIILIYLFFSLYSFGQHLQKIPKGSLITCGGKYVLIIDPSISRDTTSIIWKWSFDDHKDYFPKDMELQNFDECKPIDGGKRLLMTAGGGSCIIDVESGKPSFFIKTYNAHSADTLPGNFLVIANSLGNSPLNNRIILVNRSNNNRILFSDSLYSAHGVVWNEKYQRLFILGYDVIRLYKFHFKGDNSTLELEKEIRLPSDNGHDLSMVDAERFLVTTNYGVYLLYVDGWSFVEFKPLKGISSVKSVNLNPRTNNLIFTRAEESWWTFNIYSFSPQYAINIPFVRLYKVRALW